MQSTQQYLVTHGIKPSVQRLAIMDYLLQHHTHPTIDEVYTDLLPKVPTLSKATVYNTLKLFVQQGVALYIDIDERNARFDGEVEAHAHFRCKKCGCIIDIPLSELQNFLPNKPDFVIDEACVNMKGFCKACKLVE
ncbi:MAG: transcriptional repressor [Dysgonamonadaceae bacterium]|jgi:Fe2+ or Zn2+ uptake regulation protein|nr:transcriptional repressor [Dysgonamonadaceae bacterium]